MSVLQIRLKNCLQTILDLQPCLAGSRLASVAEDFASLKGYVARVDNMDLHEEDVARLERMASDFLKEMALANCGSIAHVGRLQ